MGPTAAVAVVAENDGAVTAAAGSLPPPACSRGLSCLYCERVLLPHDDVALVRCTVCNAVLHLCDACCLGGAGGASAVQTVHAACLGGAGGDSAVQAVHATCLGGAGGDSAVQAACLGAAGECGRSPVVTAEYHCQRHAHLRGVGSQLLG